MRFLFALFFLPFISAAQINPAFVYKEGIAFTKFESSGDGLFGFEKDGKVGYMDKNEKIIIPAIYSIEGTATYPTIPSFSKGFIRLKKDGKFGLVDKTGKVVISFNYEYLSKSTSDYATAGKTSGSKTLYGIVSIQDKVLIPLEYDDVQADSNMLILKKNNKWTLFDNTGKQLLQTDYSTLILYSKYKMLRTEKDGNLIYLDLNGNKIFEKPKSVYTLYSPVEGMILCYVSSKYGYLDLKGNEAIITKYDMGYGFESNGLARVGKKVAGTTSTYNYGFVDKKGNEIIPLKYESLSNFSADLVLAKDPETNRYGFLDKTNKWVIKPVYLEANSFDALGGAWVKMTDAKWHYINKTGKDLGMFNETTYKFFNAQGYAVHEMTDNPYVLIDKNGKVITKLTDSDNIYSFGDGIAGYRCKSNSKYGFIDYTGKIINACSYDGFSGFADGISKVSITTSGKTKSGYINASGETLVPIQYDDLRTYRNGWGIFKRDGKYFFVDKSGNEKDAPRAYDDLLDFRSGYAVGVVNGSSDLKTYYYINSDLKEEFNVSAKEAYPFWENVAIVKRNAGYELMNKHGEVFKSLSSSISAVKFCTDGLIAIKDKKWGYIDEKGNTVVEPKYDSCEQFKFGYGRFKMDGKWGILDKTGKEILPAKYTNVFSGENGVFIYFDVAWGVLDKTGKIILPPRYYTITSFEKDRALAKVWKNYAIVKSPLVK